ncbi:helix-turn-helix domain-containing protein [Campylobacter upsaliensis]|uniref:helix-turn-helix domain-containing protein n=1 Tax=Campylobacter upsaliensis TaxID=28080 RepID=UPI0022EB9AE5|nr:helix-turn-helix domain-containing protein [Campylobacter upsaliensis]
MIIKAKLKGNFTQVSNELINHPHLSNNAKLLCIKILSLPENWRLNTKYLANFLGLGVRATQKYLRELIDVGIFEKAQELDEKTAKYTQNFTIIFNSFDDEEKELNECNESPKNSESKTQSMENDGFVKDANAKSMENKSVDNGEKKPLSGINSHIYNKEFFSNKKFLYRLKNFSNRTIFLNLQQGFKIKNSFLDFSCFDEREKIEIDKWFAYKKRLLKGQFNAMSKERQLKKIKGFKLANQNIIAIINQSIEQGWQGLFAFKTSAKAQSKGSVRQKEKDDLMAYFDNLKAVK